MQQILTHSTLRRGTMTMQNSKDGPCFLLTLMFRHRDANLTFVMEHSNEECNDTHVTFELKEQAGKKKDQTLKRL